MRVAINYVADATRESPLNHAVARVLLAGWLILKLLTQVRWNVYQKWPVRVPTYNPQFSYFWTDLQIQLLPAETLVTAVLLGCVLVGYRFALTGYLSAILLLHIGGVQYVFSYSLAQMYILPALMLLVLAVYHDADGISADALRNQRSWSFADLNDRLQTQSERSYRLTAMAWLLVLLAGFYFLTGWSKTGIVPAWVSGDSIARFLLFEQVFTGRDLPIGQFIVENQWLASLGAVVALVVELGFLPAVLLGLPIGLFVAGAAIMHGAIAVTMTPLFFEQFVLLALFVPWDRLHARLSDETTLTVVYDDQCHICARTLLLLDRLDVTGVLRFVPASAPPAVYDQEQYDYTQAMFVFEGETAYRGFYGFRRIFRALGLLTPLGWALYLPGVAVVGDSAYELFAANRDRVAQCDAPDNL